jgi:hypothetical protein
MYDKSDAAVMSAHGLSSGGNDQVHLSEMRAHEFRVSRTGHQITLSVQKPETVKRDSTRQARSLVCSAR